MIILGIETSCDETASAVVKETKGKLSVLSNTISSQVKLHSRWGGVVPNLAAREHLKNVFPVIEVSLKGAGVTPQDIDLIAVTNGPGLIPALLIGTNAAKTLSYLWKKPLIGIHHIEGHIYANFVGEVKSEKLKIKSNGIKFPVLCLVVSGGHTQLILMKKHLDYEIIGQTLDDAAGEAFDKVARILGLGYPGGPIIARLATDDAKANYRVALPRPMINSKDFNFSFSGLKTAVLYEVKKNEEALKNKQFTAAMAREFQQAVIDVLIFKTIKAAKKYNPKTIMLAGGVSANRELRQQIRQAIGKEMKNIPCVIPEFSYSVDNAAMIAAAGYFRFTNMPASQKRKLFSNWKKLQTDANLKMASFKIPQRF